MSLQPTDLTKEVAAELSGILHMGGTVREYWTWYPNADMAQLDPEQVIHEQHRWFCDDARHEDCVRKNKCYIWGSGKGLEKCRKIKIDHSFTVTEVRGG
jgi:hypothetical protein